MLAVVNKDGRSKENSHVYGSAPIGLSYDVSLYKVCEALEHENYALAARLLDNPQLEGCVSGIHDFAITDAEHALWLASLYALQYQIDSAVYYLEVSAILSPDIQEDILYKTLYLELQQTSLQKANPELYSDTISSVGETIRGLEASDTTAGAVLARHHAARALKAVGAYKQAFLLLQTQNVTNLDAWLLWQHYRLLGSIEQARGHLSEALAAYDRAFSFAPEAEKDILLLHIATVWMQKDQLYRSLYILKTLVTSQEDTLRTRAIQAQRYYLKARVHIGLGNLQHARDALWIAQQQQARRDIYMLLAQVHDKLGEPWKAVQAYQWAFAQSHLEEMAHFVVELNSCLPIHSLQTHQYAYALALSKTGALDNAQHALQVLFSDHTIDDELKGKAYALQAELSLHQGDIYTSSSYAKQAVELGAVYHGYKILGHLALARYDVASAVEAFEYAASDVPRGSSPWMQVTCLIVENLARLRDQYDAKRVYLRATDVLEMMEMYTPQHPSREEMLRYQQEAQLICQQQAFLYKN